MEVYMYIYIYIYTYIPISITYINILVNPYLKYFGRCLNQSICECYMCIC